MSQQEHEHCGHPMTAVELPEVYDGICFWRCETCGAWAHRFMVGDIRRDTTEVIARLNPDVEIR